MSRALLLVAAAAVLLPVSPAHASGLPPMTQPDAVTVTIDSRSVVVDLTANDVDPESDRIFFCGTSTPIPQGVRILAGGRRTEIGASTFPGPMDTTGATPGTYTVTTVTCDDTSAVSSTLTITVLPSPGDFVDLAPKRPGRVRVVNGNDVPVRFFWGAEDHKHADGRVDIAAHASKTIRVERRSLVTVVVAGAEFAIGVERHLRPPTNGTALPPGVAHGHDAFHAGITRWVRKVVGI